MSNPAASAEVVATEQSFTSSASSASSKNRKKNQKKKNKKKTVCPFDNLQIHPVPKLELNAAAEQNLDALCSKINSHGHAFSFRMKCSEIAGRFAVASHALPEPGTVVLREVAYAFSVCYDFRRTVCANCASIFDFGVEPVGCRLCEQVRFNSQPDCSEYLSEYLRVVILRMSFCCSPFTATPSVVRHTHRCTTTSAPFCRISNRL